MADTTNPGERTAERGGRKPPHDGGEFLTDAQLCARLDVTDRTTHRWRRDGGGPPFVRVGRRRVLYRRTDVDGWLAARTFAHRAAEFVAARNTAPVTTSEDQPSTDVAADPKSEAGRIRSWVKSGYMESGCAPATAVSSAAAVVVVAVPTAPPVRSAAPAVSRPSTPSPAVPRRFSSQPE